MCNFLIECGRAQAILADTILQSDQEQFLVNLLKATALHMGNNVAVRPSAAYSSQSQGSIQRFHRTLIEQIRTLRAQVQQNYDRNISAEQPLMPGLVRHANFLLNRYLVHNTDRLTSYYRRWNKQHASPLCIFAETVQYMAQTHKTMPKLEQRFFKGVWLGKDAAIGEHALGIATRVVIARTIRRLVQPESFDKQLFDSINAYPWTPVAAAAPAALIPIALPKARSVATRPQFTEDTQTVDTPPTGKHSTEQQETDDLKRRKTITDLPLATSPTNNASDKHYQCHLFQMDHQQSEAWRHPQQRQRQRMNRSKHEPQPKQAMEQQAAANNQLPD